MIGVVKSYDRRRGLGELALDRSGVAVLVYVAEVERAGLATLAPGDRFSFDIKAERGLGRYAVNLAPLQVC